MIEDSPMHCPHCGTLRFGPVGMATHIGVAHVGEEPLPPNSPEEAELDGLRREFEDALHAATREGVSTGLRLALHELRAVGNGHTGAGRFAIDQAITRVAALLSFKKNVEEGS